MRAAIYARKSTDQNGTRDADRSVTRQIAHGKKYAKMKGWEVDESYVYVDDGVSGAEFAKRPGFLRLMNSVKPKAPFDVLIMSEESRLGRESIETAYALKQLVQAGVRIFFYMEDRERTLDSPIDKVMLSLTAFADELEREKASQRTHDAMVRKAEAGHVTGGRVFGYDNERTKAGPVRRVINQREADVVRDIYRRYVEGHGMRTIARQLNAEVAPCPKPYQGRPAGWAPSSTREILYRPLYRGEVVWNKTRKRNSWGQVEQRDRPESDWLRRSAPELRIVPKDLERAVERRLDQNKRTYIRTNGGRLWGRPSGSGESKYLLVGLATCGTCGGGISVRSRDRRKKRAYFYVCTAYHTRGRCVCANGYDLPMTATNNTVLETIAKKFLTPEVLESAISRAVEQLENRPAEHDETDVVRAELTQVEAEIQRLAEAVASGANIPAMVETIKDRERRRKALSGRLAALEAARQRGPGGNRDAMLADLRARLDDWQGLFGRHVGQTRQLLRKLLVGRLTITPDVSESGRIARITGAGTLEPLLRGVAPKLVVGPPGFEPGTSRL